MKNEFKYISNISSKEFEEKVVLSFCNEEGRPCVLIRNSKPKQNVTTGVTDNLEYHLNSVFFKDSIPYYFHMIACVKNDDYSKEQFTIAYEWLFKTMNKPKSDFEISSLINSLEQLFKVTPERDLDKLFIGVYGELLFMLHAYNSGCKQILSKYHKNFYSKHDLEIDKYNRIEVKSTISSKRIHHFSHDQLVRNDVNVYVVSILFEKSVEGVSLEELFEKIISIATDPAIILWLGQLKGYCGISKEKKGPSFAYDKAVNDLKVFDAKNLPHIELDGIKGISDVSYDVDCTIADNLVFNEFISTINELINKEK